MERDPNEGHGRRDADLLDSLGEDDQEFTQLDDVGLPPSETPAVDDV